MVYITPINAWMVKGLIIGENTCAAHLKLVLERLVEILCRVQLLVVADQLVLQVGHLSTVNHWRTITKQRGG